MTAQEAAEFIIQRWKSEHDPLSIMMQMLCLGTPLRKAEILAVIKQYCILNGENYRLRRSERP